MDNLFKEYEGVFNPPLVTSDSKDKKERLYAYSPFALQDAIGEKNVKKIWIEYEKLRFIDIGAEDLIYKIIGKVKEMLAIAMGANQEDLGIKRYPYDKSKRDIRNWKKEELESLYTKLVKVYHDSRTGGDELDVAIEKTILSI